MEIVIHNVDNFYVENMWLDGTGLEGWPQFKGFTYIKMLDLSNNNITILPKPPKFSLTDKYGKYRLQYFKEEATF